MLARVNDEDLHQTSIHSPANGVDCLAVFASSAQAYDASQHFGRYLPLWGGVHPVSLCLLDNLVESRRFTIKDPTEVEK